MPGLTKVKAVAAGSYFSLAPLANGTAKARGEDGNGELGDGELAVNSDKPAAVSGLTETTALSAHEAWAIALLRSGGVKSWGSDFDGELGLGGGPERDVPTSVSGLSGAKSVAAGFGFGLAAAPSDQTCHGVTRAARRWHLDSRVPRAAPDETAWARPTGSMKKAQVLRMHLSGHYSNHSSSLTGVLEAFPDGVPVPGSRSRPRA